MIRFNPRNTSRGSCAQETTDGHFDHRADERGRHTGSGDIRDQEANPLLIDGNELRPRSPKAREGVFDLNQSGGC